MIVEMLGSPGAGKTSLIPAAREFFSRQGLKAYNVVEAARPLAARTPLGRLACRWLPEPLKGFILWQIFYAYSRRYRPIFRRHYPQLIDSVLRYQCERPISAYDRRHVMRWFLHLTGAYAFLRTHLKPSEVLIIDEGFVHRVVQLFASEHEEPDVQREMDYLDQIPRPDLVIYVSTPAEVAVRRVFSRGLWERFQRKSQADTLRFLAASQTAVQRAAGYLASKNWPLLQIDNPDQEIDFVGQELQAELASWSASAVSAVPV